LHSKIKTHKPLARPEPENRGGGHFRDIVINNMGTSEGNPTSANATIAMGVSLLLALVRFVVPGSFQIRFTNTVGKTFTVWAATNADTPFSGWSNLGIAEENPADSGEYQFSDPESLAHSQRFYRVGVTM
jgi:hypothetical protein